MAARDSNDWPRRLCFAQWLGSGNGPKMLACNHPVASATSWSASSGLVPTRLARYEASPRGEGIDGAERSRTSNFRLRVTGFIR